MRLKEEPQFERVAVWALPTDKAAFLRWLDAAIPGDDKVATFLTYPAAAHMPPSLRAALTSVTKFSEDQPRDERGRFGYAHGSTEIPWYSADRRAGDDKNVRAIVFAWAGGTISGQGGSTDIRKGLAQGPGSISEAVRQDAVTLANAVANGKTTGYPLYRGISLDAAAYEQFRSSTGTGKTVDMNICSWSKDPKVADMFGSATNHFPHEVVFSLDPGAKAYDATYDIPQGSSFTEHISDGRFEVVSVDHSEGKDMLGRDRSMDTVHVRQTGVFTAPEQFFGTKAARIERLSFSAAKLLPWLEDATDVAQRARHATVATKVDFYTEDGVVHPIRGSEGYDEDLAGGGGLGTALSKAEDKIVGIHGGETFVALDSKGKEVLTNSQMGKTAGENSYGVDITDAQLEQMHGVTFTHNHPSGWDYPADDPRHNGNSFSPDDLKLAMQGDFKEIRAVTPTTIFSMKPGPGGWGDLATAAQTIYRASTDTRAKFTARVQDGYAPWGSTQAERIAMAEANHYDVTNQLVADNMGWTYTKVRQ